MRSCDIESKRPGVRALPLLAACAAVLTLAGCEPMTKSAQTSDEFLWARAALERNPTIEVMAADKEAEVFTVKIKRTGATQTIAMKEIGAAPISEFVAAALDTPARAPVASPAKSSESDEPAATVAQSEETDTADEPAAAASNSEPLDKTYTIQRRAGQVKVSGPGVSIVSAGPAVAAVTERNQRQQTTDPLICEGRRMVHFDNRNIYVDGNAIVARGGCELYITNSHVISSGTAVVASDSIVHIANSTIEGRQASFDAGEGARMYLRSSTFQGLPRRAERAVVQDQGGNTWR